MGEFCFSLDMEMSLGIEHSFNARHVDPLIERKAIPKILNLAKFYGIPLTFAVCGHLFLKECKGHDDLIKPTPDYYSGDWYQKDPKSNFKKNNTWYAPDLIEQVINEGHEIACHSFSHIPFNHCSEQVAEQEIKLCVNIAKDWNLKFETFVFPRNEVNYLHLLEKHGFSRFTSNPKPKCFLIDYKVLGLSFNKPQGKGKLLEIPRSFFVYRTKQSDLLKLKAVFALVKMQDSFFHLWSHPWNFNTPEYFTFLEKVFKMVNKSGLQKKMLNQVELKK